MTDKFMDRAVEAMTEQEQKTRAGELAHAMYLAQNPSDLGAFEVWNKGLHQGAKNDEERAANWARLAILYAYIEAKLLMCNDPEAVRVWVNTSRAMITKTGDRGWAAFCPMEIDEHD